MKLEHSGMSKFRPEFLNSGVTTIHALVNLQTCVISLLKSVLRRLPPALYFNINHDIKSNLYYDTIRGMKFSMGEIIDWEYSFMRTLCVHPAAVYGHSNSCFSQTFSK